MKKLLPLLMILLIGCATTGELPQIDQSATHQAIAYASGKGLAIAIQELAPKVDKDLTLAWVSMMDRNEGKDTIEPPEMLLFWNECLIAMTLHVDDPYGLLGDLGVLLMIFGAEFNSDGDMVMVQPVPMAIMRFFEMGYSNGRRVAQN